MEIEKQLNKNFIFKYHKIFIPFCFIIFWFIGNFIKVVISGGSCFLVTWDLIELYPGYMRPIPWEISFILTFYTLKGIELFEISYLILFELAASNLFLRWLYESSYSNIWFSLFKIMKDRHLFNVFIFNTFIFFWIVFPFRWKIKLIFSV